MRMMSEALERQGKHEEAKVMATRGLLIAESLNDEGREEKLSWLHEFYRKLNPTLLNL